MKAQAGFTLVETLTAGAISTILAASLLSLMDMSNTQIEESLERQEAVAIYTAISDQIHAMARRAKTVRTLGEATPINVWPAPPHPGQGGYQNLLFFDEANNLIGGFQINVELGLIDLREWSTVSNGWEPYTIMGTPILFDDDQAFSFSITAGRRACTFQFDLKFTKDGRTTTHKFPRERVQCKNQFP